MGMMASSRMKASKTISDLGRLSASGTVVAHEVGAAGGTLVFVVGKRSHLVRLLFPLLELSVSILQVVHSDCKGTKKWAEYKEKADLSCFSLFFS
jgi:hypothetical protein